MLSSLFPFAVRNPGFETLTREMDRLLQAAAPTQGIWSGAPSSRWPGLNVWRDGDSIVAEAEVPGFKMEDIEVLAAENTLTVSGKRSLNAPENAAALRIERRVTSFERSIELPIAIRPDAVEATLVNGVLRVTMPVAEAVKARRVEVKAIAPEPARAALPEGAASSSGSSKGQSDAGSR
jgi:HSP20 family protein